MFRVSTLDPDKLPKRDGKTDYSQDFFQKPAFLTVSGQLEAEIFACALGKVYTFGPTFRAENSNTARHLAEFWMVEPEMAFFDLNDNMDLAERFLKRIIRDVLERCAEDMAFFNERIEPKLLETLQQVASKAFERVSYTEAISILESSGKQFEYPVKWGIDLQSEHERYLTEEKFRCPVILYDYPKQIKAFYMRLNEDDKTVRAMDVLVPHVGEIIGGSQREERLEGLEARMRGLRRPAFPPHRSRRHHAGDARGPLPARPSGPVRAGHVFGPGRLPGTRRIHRGSLRPDGRCRCRSARRRADPC